MRNNPIQFAVVREDPQIELDIIRKFQLNKATLIASGGCSAFSLRSAFPNLDITLIEPNPAQIWLIQEKINSLKKSQIENFGIGKSNQNNFIECGNFESLFRQFRHFIYEFIVSESEIKDGFLSNSTDFWLEIFTHKYWQTAFDLFFSDSILVAMFTEAAIQHAPKSSYPKYFRKVLEKGLIKPDISQNYFLHHIFLGYYFETALPLYLIDLPTNLEFVFFNGLAGEFDNFNGRQLVHFSNIFDWCDSKTVGKIAQNAADKLEKGSIVVSRQLNNDKNYRSFFGDNFHWHQTSEIVENDRSLFYQKIEIGEKIA